MATAAVGPNRSPPPGNLGSEEVGKTLEDTLSFKGVEEKRAVKALNGSSSATSASGPPVLHPTIPTWQWLFAASDMHHTPTVLHSGVTPEQERFWRWKGAQLIFRIGDYMRLGNHVMTSAAIFLHRFYMRRAMPKDPSRDRPHDTFTFQEMAPTCIFLACKVEETHRKLHGVVEATMAVMDRTPLGIDMAEARTYKVDVKSKEYRRWKDVVLLHEERLLETMCFDLIIEQPHPIAIKACKRLGTSRDMAQLTVILLNTILYGAVCTFYDAATLAAAAFQKACNLVEVDPASYTAQFNTSRTWYDAFDVDPDEVSDAMPDVDDQMVFHNDTLSAQQPMNTWKSHASTPNVHQHSSMLIQRGDPRSPAPVPSFEVPSKRLHFANQEVVIEGNEKPVNEVLSAPLMERQEVRESGEEDNWAVGREERTDPSRPISRHGSKGANRGPPPPMAQQQQQEESEEGQVELSADPHEEAAAAKVHREQIQQEEAAQTSEEEGAL